MSDARWFVGVDVGGTFTDVVLANADGRFHVDKMPTTPDDPRVGVIDGGPPGPQRCGRGAG